MSRLNIDSFSRPSAPRILYIRLLYNNKNKSFKIKRERI